MTLEGFSERPKSFPSLLMNLEVLFPEQHVRLRLTVWRFPQHVMLDREDRLDKRVPIFI